jgi:hypothetical protein
MLIPALSGTILEKILFREVKFVARGIPSLADLSQFKSNISIYAKVDIKGLPLPIDITNANVEINLSRVNFGMNVKLPEGVKIGDVGLLKAGSLKINFDFDLNKPFFTALVKPPIFGISGNFVIPALQNLVVTGLFQLAPKVTAPNISISLLDYLKGIRPTDFVFISLLPPDFKITQLLAPLNIDSLGIPSLSTYLAGLPIPQIAFIYSPIKLDKIQFNQILGMLNLDANLLKMFDSLRGLSIGYNFASILPSFSLNSILPADLISLPDLKNINFDKIVFNLQNLPSLDLLIKKNIDLNIAGPDINFEGFTDISKLDFLKNLPFDLKKLPFKSIIKNGILRFDIDPGIDIEIPGLNIGKLSRPILSVTIDIKKKNFDITLNGVTTVRNPILGVDVESEVALNFTHEGITGIGKILKPLATIPFSKAFPGFSNISFDLSKTSFYISNKVYVDPNLKVTINPGITLFSQLSSAKISDVLGAMVPAEIGGVTLSNGKIFVGMEFDKAKGIAIPRVNFSGRFNLSSLGSVTNIFSELTKLGIKFPVPDLTAIDGVITIDPTKNITIECKWAMSCNFTDLIPGDILAKFPGDFSIDKFFKGGFKDPRIKINIPMKDFKPQSFSIEIAGDLPLQFPFLKDMLNLPFDFNPGGTLSLVFDSVKMKLVERIFLNQDLAIPGLPAIKMPCIQFVQMPNVSEIFSIVGDVSLSKIGDISIPEQVAPAFLTAALKDKKITFKFEAALNGSIQPFKTIKEFAVPGLPSQLVDISLSNAKIGCDVKPGMLQGYVYGDAQLFGFDANLLLKAVSESEGKSGVSVVCNFNNYGIANPLMELVKNILPPAYSAYNQLGAVKVGTLSAKSFIDAAFNVIKLDKFGLVFSSLNCVYDVDPEKGFVANPNGTTQLASGFSIYAKVKLSDLPPIPNPFGEPIDPLKILFTKFSPSAYGILTTGTSLSEWGITVFVDSSETELNTKRVNFPFISFSGESSIPGFKLNKATLGANVKFQPLGIGATARAIITPTTQTEPLQYSAQLAFLPLSQQLLGSFTMAGKWYKPFGIDFINYYGDIAGQIYLDLKTKAVGDGASMGASGGAAPAVPLGGGLTGKLKLGSDSDPRAKELAFALNITQEVSQILLWAKLGGKYGKGDLIRLCENIDMVGNGLASGVDFLRKLIPENPSGKKSDLLSLTPVQEFSLAAPNALADMTSTGGGFEKILGTGAPAIPFNFSQMINDFATISKKFKVPDFHLSDKVAQLPDFEIEDIEVKFAPDTTKIGELTFSRGLVLAGKLNIFGKKAGINFRLDITGLACSGYLPDLDLGECVGFLPGMKDFASPLKGLVSISGVGEAPGPKMDIKLNMENIANPETSFSGKVKFVPYLIEGEGLASLSLKGGMIVDFKTKISGSRAEFKCQSDTIDGKPVIKTRVAFDLTDLANLKSKIVQSFSSIKVPSAQDEINKLNGELATVNQKVDEVKGFINNLLKQVGLA